MMKQVLLLYREMIPSVRLCALAPLSHLAETQQIAFRSTTCGQLTVADFNWCNTIVLVRADGNLEVELTKLAKKAGKQLVYVLDDDLLDVPSGLSSSEHYQAPATKRNITNILSTCDLLLSPSAHLLQKYGHMTSQTGRIEEPVVGLCPEPKVAVSQGPLKVGFAGGLDRNDDLSLILDEVIGYFKTNFPEKFTFEFFGGSPSCAAKYGLTVLPYQPDYRGYQAQMERLNWDIGLAPLSDRPFNAGKHYNKLIEYSALGIVGIYSDVAPYKEKVRTGEIGFLCANTSQAWIDTLLYLDENPTALQLVQQNVLSLANTAFSLSTVAADYLDLLQLLPPKKPSQPVSHFSFICHLKIKAFLLRCFGFLRKYGLRSIPKAIGKIQRKICGAK